LAAAASAQTTTSVLSGYVTDPARRPVANARVLAADTARGFERATQTDPSGFYRLANLPPSTYTVSASAPTLAESTVADVRIEVDSPRRLDIALALPGA